MIIIDEIKSLALIRIEGSPSLDEIKQKVSALIQHPQHTEGMDELWDFSKADMTHFNFITLKVLSDHLTALQHKLSNRTAFVVSRDVEYGIGRMWQSCAEHAIPNHRQLFRNIHEAYSWLDSPAGFPDDSALV